MNVLGWKALIGLSFECPRVERVTVDALEPRSGTAPHRDLTESLGLEHVAMNHYRLDPGDRLAGLHAHEHQEEVFVVLRGTARFETLEGRVNLEADETIRFGPGEHKSGLNPSDEATVVLALGAPVDGGDVLIPLSCPSCDHDEVRLEFVDGRERLRCPACGTATSPSCPDCGSNDLAAVLHPDTDRPVSRCRECASLFDL